MCSILVCDWPMSRSEVSLTSGRWFRNYFRLRGGDKCGTEHCGIDFSTPSRPEALAIWGDFGEWELFIAEHLSQNYYLAKVF